MQPSALSLPYQPRASQAQVHQAFQRHRFLAICAHRRWGKSHVGIVGAIADALAAPLDDPVTCAIIFPLRTMARAVGWPILRSLLDPLGPLADCYESTLTAYLGDPALPQHRRSSVVLAGSDSPDNLRGLKLKMAVLDECALHDPSVWPLIIRPCLADSPGSRALFISSARPGPWRELYFSAAARQREGDSEWGAMTFAAEGTDALPQEEIERLRADLTGPQFAQEFLCSWTAANEGSVLGPAIEQAYAENRIAPAVCAYDPGRPVHVALDLGHHDACVWFFAQLTPTGPRIIGGGRMIGGVADDAVEALQATGYQFSCVALPFDARNVFFSNRSTTLETFARAFPGVVRVLKRSTLGDKINAGRKLMAAARIDERACGPLLARLNAWEYATTDSGERSAAPAHSDVGDSWCYLGQSLAERELLPAESRTVSVTVPGSGGLTIQLPALDQSEVPALPVVSLNGRQYIRGDFLEGLDGSSGGFFRRNRRERLI